MKQYLIAKLKGRNKYNEDWTHWAYSEHINVDANTGAWFTNGSSYIYRVGVVAAIDANKCDWVVVAIGMQRHELSNPELVGTLHFPGGENDDIARVLKRAMKCMQMVHPVFDE